MGDIDLPLGGFIALDWSLLLAGLIFVSLRLYIKLFTTARVRQTPAKHISDCCVIGAWLSGAVLVSINTWKNSLRMKYLNQPAPDLYYGVPKHLAGHLLKVSWISLYFIYISLWLIKAAFLTFYLHLFSRLGSWHRPAQILISIFTLLTFLLHMGLLTFWCHPISRNYSINGDICSAVHDMTSVTISTFFNIATDIVIISLPLYVLSKNTLSRDRRQVVMYATVIIMGSLSIVAAIVRWGALKAVWGQPKASVTHTIDVWAMVEILTGLVAVCAPSLRVAIRGEEERRGVKGEERYVFEGNGRGSPGRGKNGGMWTMETGSMGTEEELGEIRLQDVGGLTRD